MNDRYPKDLTLTVNDFEGCGWKAALACASREDYFSMSEAFSAAAKQAIDEGRQAHGKVLWLLSDACSMMLKPVSVNEPFEPIIVIDGRRSAMPDDFSGADIEFFAQIVDAIDNPKLKARLADLVWLMQRPRRDIRFALAAIDSYRSVSLSAETWARGGYKCWERAIQLARLHGKGAGDRLDEMEAAIITKLESSTKQDNFFCFKLAGLLKSGGLGGDRSNLIAEKLESVAREFDCQNHFYHAREYFQASAEWFQKAENEGKSTELTIEAAETFVKEAKTRITSDQPSYMVAASFHENAIQIYRTIPRSKRAEYRVDERIVELRKLLSESSEKMLDEMKVIEVPRIDISEIVENARKSIRSKNPIEALRAFSNLHLMADSKKLRENATDQINRNSLQTLLPGVAISSDGRVIARHAGSSPTDSNETVIRYAMIRNHDIQIGIIVQGMIWPALEEMLLEHRLNEADFIRIAKQSSIVPIGRELLFGKALFAGYERDFAVAIHLLTPQIEHMVRFHLKQAGVQTTNLDNDGIEQENGLSSLMNLPQAEKIFGEDLSFEIKALFCDPFGPNLRNELAHGLLDDRKCWSVHAVYAWWLGLKLVFNTFFNTLRKDTEDTENSGQNEEQ